MGLVDREVWDLNQSVLEDRHDWRVLRLSLSVLRVSGGKGTDAYHCITWHMQELKQGHRWLPQSLWLTRRQLPKYSIAKRLSFWRDLSVENWRNPMYFTIYALHVLQRMEILGVTGIAERHVPTVNLNTWLIYCQFNCKMQTRSLIAEMTWGRHNVCAASRGISPTEEPIGDNLFPNASGWDRSISWIQLTPTGIQPMRPIIF